MAINTLTDADCRRATPNDGKLRKLFDGHGLMLAVLPSGNKVWRMAYRNDEGKQQTAVIGPYPLIGLKEARERRDVLRLKLIDGDDLKPKRKAAHRGPKLPARAAEPTQPWGSHVQNLL